MFRSSVLAILLVAMYIVLCREAGAAPSFVKSAPTATATCQGSFTESFTPTNAGDTWCLTSACNASTTDPNPASVTDNNGGTWTAMVGECNGNLDNVCVNSFCSPNHPGGATTITVNLTGGAGTCSCTMDVFEFTGMPTTLVPDGTPTPHINYNTTTTRTTPSATSAMNNDVCIGMDSINNTGYTISSGPTNSYTGADAVFGGSRQAQIQAWLIQSLAGATNTAWTISISGGTGSSMEFCLASVGCSHHDILHVSQPGCVDVN